MLNGTDISEFQGSVNFDELGTATDFVMVRANFGVPEGGRTDVQFARNWSEASRVGLHRGAYHYAYPANSADSSAESFIEAVGTLLPGDVLALDFEEPFGDPVGWSLNWLNSVYEATNVRPLLYINLSLATGHDWTPVVNAGYGLWLAQWDFDPTSNSGNTAWPFTAMRQWTDKGTVHGISGLVDQDVFYGDSDAFAKYGYQTPVVTPIPEPAPAPTEPAPPVEPSPLPVPTPSLPTPSPLPMPVPTTPSPLPPWEQDAVNWLGTTAGGLVLKLIGVAIGYLSAHAGLLHVNDIASSFVGLVLGSTIHDFNNPKVPNKVVK